MDMITDNPKDAWFSDSRLYSSFPIHRKQQIRRDGEAYVWLEQDLHFVVDFETGPRRQFRIKKGYFFDGASIPLPAQIVIGPPLGGAYEAPACAHDILCESRAMNAWNAGLVFNMLMDNVGVAEWRRKLMWTAVRRLCQPIQDAYPATTVQLAAEHLDIKVV